MTQEKIKATNDTIQDIVKQEIERLGNNADINHIDVSAVTDMLNLFSRSKFNGDISKWDVSNVKYMNWMFSGSTFNGDISQWNVSNVEDVNRMFIGSMFDGDISQWDISNVEDMGSMFKNSKFNGDISNWDVSKVEAMRSMFESSKFNGDISNWDVSNVQDMSRMFKHSKFNGDISKWNVSNVQDAWAMFEGSSFNGDISKWNVSNVRGMDEIEITQGIIKATNETIKGIVTDEIERLGNNADLNHIDVSAVTDMAKLFSYSSFNGDISQWNVSNVENMKLMFRSSEFDGDISKWDVSKVWMMDGMFGDSPFNGDISQWDVSNVENMELMFGYSKFNGDLSKWDVSWVKNMKLMFYQSRFDGDISKWNVSNVKKMSQMFDGSKFTGDISGWDVSNVEDTAEIGEIIKATNKTIKQIVKQDVSADARELSELSYEDAAIKLSEAKLEPEMVAGILNEFFDPDLALKVLVTLKTIDKTQANSVRAILIDHESKVMDVDKRLKEEDLSNINTANLFPYTFAQEMLDRIDRPEEILPYRKALTFIQNKRSDQIEDTYQKLQANPADEEILAELDREKKQQTRVVDLFTRKSKTKTLIEERKGAGEYTKDLEELMLVYAWAALNDVSIDDDEVLRSEYRNYYEKQVPDMEHPSPEEAVKMIKDGNDRLLRYLAFRWHRTNNVDIDDIEENVYLFKYMEFIGVKGA